MKCRILLCGWVQNSPLGTRSPRAISSLLMIVFMASFTAMVTVLLSLWSGSSGQDCGTAGLELVSCSFVRDGSGGYAIRVLAKNSGGVPLERFHIVARYGNDVVFDARPSGDGVVLYPNDYRTLISKESVSSADAFEVVLETETCSNARGTTKSCQITG